MNSEIFFSLCALSPLSLKTQTPAREILSRAPPPTYNELVRLFDMKSKGSVHTYIKKFFDSGLIRKSDHGKLIPTDKLYGLGYSAQ